jgi:hypothetical protein
MLRKDALGLRRDKRGRADLPQDFRNGPRAEDVPGKHHWAAKDPALREARESPRQNLESRCTHESLLLRAAVH